MQGCFHTCLSVSLGAAGGKLALQEEFSIEFVNGMALRMRSGKDKCYLREDQKGHDSCYRLVRPSASSQTTGHGLLFHHQLSVVFVL